MQNQIFCQKKSPRRDMICEDEQNLDNHLILIKAPLNHTLKRKKDRMFI